MLNEPPLVGRDEELSRLSVVLKDVLDAHGKVFFISGEGGIGKSRLAKEFEKQAKAQGCKVLVGNCVPSSRINYMPFLEALNQLADDKAEEKHEGKAPKSKFFQSAKKAAPDLMEAVPIVGNILKGATVMYQEYQALGQDGEGDDKQMLFATLQLLQQECAKRPIVMQIDDLQWADSASVGMLHFLARNIKDMRILLLGIYRPEDILLDRKVGGNPFLDSLRIMRRESLCDELTLKPLTEGEISQVASGMLDRPVNSVIVNRIYRESGGKPLFAVETIRQMEGSGALTCKEGTWSLSEKETEIPTSVKEVVLRRIERLSKEERRSLEYASVMGMCFDPEMLADALKIERLELLESLEHLHDDHQLVKEVEGGYVFEEEKVRRVTYDSISKLRRKEVHRAFGQMMEKKLPNESLYPDLARHFNMAGDAPKAVKYSILAGQFSLDRQVVEEAFRYFELAVELTGKEQSLKEERPRALEGLADCYTTRDKARADSLFEECLALYHEDKERARVHRKQAECWLQNALGKGDGTKARDLLERAEGFPGSDLSEKGEIELLKGQLARFDGDLELMERLFSNAKELFKQSGSMTRLADTLFLEILAAIQIAKIGWANELLSQLRQINTGIDSNRTDAEIMMCQGALRSFSGEMEGGSIDLKKAVDIACPLGNYRLLSTIMIWRGNSYLEAGLMEKALLDFREGQEYARSSEKTFETALLVHCESICEVKLGKLKEAEGDIKDVTAIASTYQGFLGSILKRFSDNGLAILLFAKGDLKASVDAFTRGLDGLDPKQPFVAFLELSWRREYANLLSRMEREEEAIKQTDRIRELAEFFGNTSGHKIIIGNNSI
jgi:hypothetical protein